MWLVSTAVAATRWALSMKGSSVIELQIVDHYDAYCGRKAGIDDRDGCQNEFLAVAVSLRWGGEKRVVLLEGAATASDRKSQRRAAANVSCRPVALRKAMGCVTCVRCCQARFASFTF